MPPYPWEEDYFEWVQQHLYPELDDDYSYDEDQDLFYDTTTER